MDNVREDLTQTERDGIALCEEAKALWLDHKLNSDQRQTVHANAYGRTAEQVLEARELMETYLKENEMQKKSKTLKATNRQTQEEMDEDLARFEKAADNFEAFLHEGDNKLNNAMKRIESLERAVMDLHAKIDAEGQVREKCDIMTVNALTAHSTSDVLTLKSINSINAAVERRISELENTAEFLVDRATEEDEAYIDEDVPMPCGVLDPVLSVKNIMDAILGRGPRYGNPVANYLCEMTEEMESFVKVTARWANRALNMHRGFDPEQAYLRTKNFIGMLNSINEDLHAAIDSKE